MSTPNEEELLWEGGPSQYTNFGLFVLCGLLCWLVVPIFFALRAYLRVRATRFTLTTQRLRMQTGIFGRKLNELELYRVKDTTLDEPFLLRMVSLGNIVVNSNDASTPRVVLKGIRNAESVRERLRKCVEARRDQKAVRVAELE